MSQAPTLIAKPSTLALNKPSKPAKTSDECSYDPNHCLGAGTQTTKGAQSRNPGSIESIKGYKLMGEKPVDKGRTHQIKKARDLPSPKTLKPKP